MDEINRTMTGIVDEIERYAINDGEGIRSIVFLKGCPLRCQWCSNPESQREKSEVLYWKTRCIGCRKCAAACPKKAISFDDREGHRIDRSLCDGCGVCIEACNSEALTLAGKKMTVQEVLDEVMKDKVFYDSSGGGVTFSGGEAMMQLDFMVEIIKELRKNGISTCMETAGLAPSADYLKMIPYIDQFLFDLKIMDPERHKEYTGVSNRMILHNLKMLLENGTNVKVRIPTIPGINASEENMNKVIEFLKGYEERVSIGLLPYHRLGTSKYEKLDRMYELDGIEPPPGKEMEHYRQMFIKSGFRTTIGE